MYPILFKIPLFGLFGHEYFPVHSYGVMMALGFLIASWYLTHTAKREGEDPAKAMDLIFYILIFALVGSRVLHVLVAERDLFFQNPLHILKIWQGGLVFYGGFIGAFLTSLWYFRKHHLPAFKYLDFFAPGIALGHAIGRQGCFLAGCCHGKPMFVEKWFSVIYPAGSLAPVGIPLYPTQVTESLLEFFIFLFLAWKLKHKCFDGQIMSLYLMLYATGRFFLEFWRGDTDRGFVFGDIISTSQFIAIILFAMGAALYLYRQKTCDTSSSF